MALTATEEARRELAALRSRIADCRRELGIEAGKPVEIRATRSRRSRQASGGYDRARLHVPAA